MNNDILQQKPPADPLVPPPQLLQKLDISCGGNDTTDINLWQLSRQDNIFINHKGSQGSNCHKNMRTDTAATDIRAAAAAANNRNTP